MNWHNHRGKRKETNSSGSNNEEVNIKRRKSDQCWIQLKLVQKISMPTEAQNKWIPNTLKIEKRISSESITRCEFWMFICALDWTLYRIWHRIDENAVDLIRLNVKLHWSYIATVNQHHCFFCCYDEFSLENLASAIFFHSHHHCTTGWFSTVCRFHLFVFYLE